VIFISSILITLPDPYLETLLLAASKLCAIDSVNHCKLRRWRDLQNGLSYLKAKWPRTTPDLEVQEEILQLLESKDKESDEKQVLELTRPRSLD
jgi:hypothetical protein